MSIDRSNDCRHYRNEKECMRNCNRTAYGRCPACQRKVCLQHLSEHHRIEIEPHFDILIDRANQIRAKLETMSIDGTKQRAQQFVEAWKNRTIASIERAVADKMIEIDGACAELTVEMSQFKLDSLAKLKSDMLLASPHVHREYVHPDELSRLEQLLTIINSHIDRYSKHELLEYSTTTTTTSSTTPQQDDNRSSTLCFYHEQLEYN
ncbi:unnamed protein product [Adineta steineri]|uniref:Uncharacterized protein n=1 Tax=Adineta steineri TaxID=433720 RepID=A0A815KGZ8_9BILA|nr:unnamed protein product [Adineta steineri]CAF1393043.1 unnamed protein product [Adineta steineri]